MGIAKSIGFAILIEIFVFFSETVSQIHFKRDGDMPWVGLYQVCSNCHDPVIFEFFMIFVVVVVFTCLLITMQVNEDCKVNRVCNAKRHF